MLNFFNKLDPYWFIISFCIGIFICYITEPQKHIIIKHPTPDNQDSTIYSDKFDSSKCFKYIANEVKCPVNKNLILDTPLNIKQIYQIDL